MNVNMDNILKAQLGNNNDLTDSIEVEFTKTVNIRQYESEVYKLKATLKVPNNTIGAERMLMLGILQAQLEYELLCTLMFKKIIKPEDLLEKRTQLEEGVRQLMVKAEELTGKSMRHILDTGE